MAVSKTKTRKASETERMIELMAQQNAQMMTLMGKLLDQNTEASKAQREWLSLFKPPTSPTKSTSFEDREAIRQNDAMWDELDMKQLQQSMARELLAPASGDDDGEF
jgi:hypothetical protein